MNVLVAQLCLTLCDAMNHNLPGQEYWSGLPFSSSGDLLDPGIESSSSVLQTDSLPYTPMHKKNKLQCTEECEKEHNLTLELGYNLGFLCEGSLVVPPTFT